MQDKGREATVKSDKIKRIELTRDRFSFSQGVILPGGSRQACPCAMISKRYVRLVFATILLLAVIIVYVTLFRHPPAEELIKMNRKKPADVEFSFEREFDFDDLLDDVDDKDDDDSEGRVVTRHSKSKTRDEKRIKGKGTWDKFLNDNGHTSIGSVFDDCGE